MKKIKVQLIKSTIGSCKIHKNTVIGLGLRKIRSIKELKNTPSIQGMINKVSHLVKILD